MAGNSTTLSVRVLIDATQAAAGLNQLSGHVEQTGSRMSTAMKAGALAAGVAILAFAKNAVESLARIETINAQTEAAIKSTGGAAGVTGEHIQNLSQHLQDLTATEAESIQEGANLLLTFTNIQNRAGEGNDIFDQSTAIMVDMARAMGTDVAGGAIQLGKALNDPVAGITALTRVGVTFSAEQKQMIADMVAVGDVAGAQKIILAELNKEFGGSGEAFAATAAGRYAQFKDALEGIAESVMGVVMPALGVLMTAGTNLLGWVMDLPGPIQAVATAFLAWGVATIVTGLGGLLGALSLLPTALGLAGLAVKGFFVNIGPIGWGILAITAALSLWYALMGDNEEAVPAETDAVKALKDTLDDTTGAVTAATRALAAKQMVDEGTYDMLERVGVSQEDYVDAMLGVPGAAERLSAGVGAATEKLFAQGGALEDLVPLLDQAHISQADFVTAVQSGNLNLVTEQVQNYITELAKTDSAGAAEYQRLWNAAMADGKVTLEELAGIMPGVTTTAEDLAAAQVQAAQAHQAAGITAEDLATAYDDLKASLKAAADSTELQTTLDGVKTSADDAKRALEYVNAEIDRNIQLLNGSTGDLDAARVAWSALLQAPTGEGETSKVADFFAAYEDGTGVLNSWNTAALGTKPAGEAIFAQLTDIAGGFRDANNAAYENAAATGGAAAGMAAMAAESASGRASFLEWAAPLAAAGVDIEALANRLGIIDLTTLSPKFLEVITQDENARAALAALDAISIDTKTIRLVADNAATPEIESAIVYTDSVTHQDRTIKLTGDATDARAVLIAIVADINAAHPGSIPINADGTPAVGTLNGVVGAVNNSSGTVDINGNPVPASNTANSLVNGISGRNDGVLSIIGNSAPARNAVSALLSDISGMSATVTVNIVANTSGYMNSWNTLPSSKPIAAGAPMVSGLAAPEMAAAAPELAVPFLLPQGGNIGNFTVEAPVPVVNNSYNFTINGALDPDGVARTVKTMLDRRERRSGGIVI